MILFIIGILLLGSAPVLSVICWAGAAYFSQWWDGSFMDIFEMLFATVALIGAVMMFIQ